MYPRISRGNTNGKNTAVFQIQSMCQVGQKDRSRSQGVYKGVCGDWDLHEVCAS